MAFLIRDLPASVPNIVYRVVGRLLYVVAALTLRAAIQIATYLPHYKDCIKAKYTFSCRNISVQSIPYFLE